MAILGTTLFSFTPDWRAGADVATLLERLAGAGCGPAVEVIGHQAWPGFPQIDADDEQAFRDAVDRLGLVPVALGVYTDLYRRPGRVMTDDEAFADITPQLAVAARLGFETVRATLGMTPALLRRVLDEAERLGVVLTFEVQGANAPDAAPVVELLSLQQQTGTPHLGLTLDFSLTTPALPEAFGTALQRCGLTDDEVERVHSAWAAEGPIGARIGTALAVVRGLGSKVPSACSSPACSAAAAARSPPTGRTCCRSCGTRTPSSGTRTSSPSGRPTARGSGHSTTRATRARC